MKKIALGLSLAVFALALFLAYRLAADTGGAGSAASGSAPAQAAAAPEGEPEPLSSPLAAADAEAPAAAAPAPAPAQEIAAPQTERAVRRDASGTQVAAGRLVPPAGMPADPTLSIEVYLEDVGHTRQDADSEKLHERVAVEADGSFELGLPADTAGFWTIARGRYVVAALERFELPLAEPLALAPQLGGWIAGTVVPPAGAELDPDETTWKVRLRPDPLASISMGNPMAMGGTGPRTENRIAEVDREDGFSFEIRGVLPGEGYTLALVPDSFAAVKTEPFDVEPGQDLAPALRLGLGGVISGRVVDLDGAGIAEAGIEAVQDPFMYGQGGLEVRDGETEADGTFVLRAVRAGELVLKFEADGFLDKNATIELAEGQTIQGFEMVLDSGSRIAGRVLWPDGTPAVEVGVGVGFDPSFLGGMEAFNAMRGADGSGETDEQGHFTVTGLGKGPFVVQVAAEPETDGAEEGTEWRARASAVRPGTEDLVLTLEPPLGVAGRVVDDLGAPVTEFTVYARTKTSGMIAGLGAETSSEHFEDDEGHFFLDGLRGGEWEVFAGQPGYGQGASVPLTMPLVEGEELVLVLERAATVEGVVLDPGGNPVAGATVGPQFSLADIGRIGVEDGQAAAKTTSDEAGRFVLAGLSSGSQDLVAQATGFAPSAAVGVEIEPAQVLEDVVFTLRTGGRILGTIYDDEGQGWGGQTVLCQDPTMTSGQHWATSDAAGEFTFENLAPTTYQVMTFPKRDQVPGGDGGGEDAGADFASMFADMKFTMAEVVDGEDTLVELGAKPSDPVQLNGRVIAGGEPVPGTMVTLIADGEGALESMKFTNTDGEGRFSLQLMRPGRYMINVQQMAGTGQQQSIEMMREIPEVDEHEVTLDLPMGGISGLIRGPDGRPVKNARVSLSADGPIANGSFTGGNYAEIWTGDDGSYVLRWLRPGKYSVAAGGAFLGGLFGDTGEQTYGRQVRRVDVDEGRLLKGVDFKLEEPGSIKGRVVDLAGIAVADAAIFLRDDDGNPIDRISMVQTDSNGRFEYSSLQPGPYQVHARADGLVSSEPATVRVRESEAAEVDLSVDAGTVLVVSLTDREGNHVRCRVKVTDPSGNQVNGLWSFDDLMKVFSGGGFSTDEQRVGPLPPGKYKIEATADDGRDARKTVTLSGQEERPVKLRLK